MEEQEMNVKQLFHFINSYDGDFFIRVILREEGDLCGEAVKCSGDSACGRPTPNE